MPDRALTSRRGLQPVAMPIARVLFRILLQQGQTVMDQPPDPGSKRSKRRSEIARERAEHHAITARRKKWLAEHPNIADQPAPERPWGSSQEAPRGGPWWGVKRMGPHGNVSHRSMFRHASRASAEREATFLAETFPGAVFVVLEAVSVHFTGTPEIKVEADTSPSQ